MSRPNDPTVPMSDDLLRRIDEQLEYGDSRAAWIREAARQRLNRETTADADADTDDEPNHNEQPAD